MEHLLQNLQNDWMMGLHGYSAGHLGVCATGDNIAELLPNENKSSVEGIEFGCIKIVSAI
jgi:hypothetical protein